MGRADGHNVYGVIKRHKEIDMKDYVGLHGPYFKHGAVNVIIINC